MKFALVARPSCSAKRIMGHWIRLQSTPQSTYQISPSATWFTFFLLYQNSISAMIMNSMHQSLFVTRESKMTNGALKLFWFMVYIKNMILQLVVIAKYLGAFPTIESIVDEMHAFVLAQRLYASKDSGAIKTTPRLSVMMHGIYVCIHCDGIIKAFVTFVTNAPL
jgi:hypothetical protein